MYYKTILVLLVLNTAFFHIDWLLEIYMTLSLTPSLYTRHVMLLCHRHYWLHWVVVSVLRCFQKCHTNYNETFIWALGPTRLTKDITKHSVAACCGATGRIYSNWWCHMQLYFYCCASVLSTVTMQTCAEWPTQNCNLLFSHKRAPFNM